MNEQQREPIEETPEFADAVEDDVAVPHFITGGGPDADSPEFRPPGAAPDPGTARPGPGTAEPDPGTAVRTGADQPWDPEDLAVAEGRDPTPDAVARARDELEHDGPAAVERTVP